MHLAKQIIEKIQVLLNHPLNIIIRKKLNFVISVDIRVDILRILVVVPLREVISRAIKQGLIFCEFGLIKFIGNTNCIRLFVVYRFWPIFVNILMIYYFSILRIFLNK